MGGYAVRSRVAAVLLLVGALLAVVGSALPFLYVEAAGSVTVTSAWQTTLVPSPGTGFDPVESPMSQGYLLVLAAMLAGGAAISGLATARRDPLALRPFGALAAGFLAAATLAFPVEFAIAPVTSGPGLEKSFGAGIPVELCGCAAAVAAGVLLLLGRRVASSEPWSPPPATSWPTAQPGGVPSGPPGGPWPPQQPQPPHSLT